MHIQKETWKEKNLLTCNVNERPENVKIIVVLDSDQFSTKYKEEQDYISMMNQHENKTTIADV